MNLRAYISTHAFYLILIACGLIGFRAWLGEHDARLRAEESFEVFQSHIAETDKQAKVEVEAIRKIAVPIKTPTQAIAAIPRLTNAPLAARLAPDLPQDVEVAALPLVAALEACREDEINLKACRSDLADTQKQIKALKKKPSFFHRLSSTMKLIGIGAAVGALLVAFHA